MFLRWLTGNRKDHRDPDEKKIEVWESHFGLFSDRRFPLEEGDDYRLTQHDRSLELILNRPRLFAWVTDPIYVYQDFILEADLEIERTQGYGSGGFIVRQGDEANYYLFLISTQGQFRFDLVFNGHPRTLLPWTALPETWNGRGTLTLLARGDRFLFLLDGEWIGEAWDDEVQSGRLALSGQSYEAGTLSVKLHRIRLDSRPLEVETLWARWNELLLADPDQRLVLAESLATVGSWAEASHQILEALKAGEVSKEGLFLLVQCLTRLQSHDEAQRVLEQILEKNPQWDLALKEKAGILYSRNRFLELKDFILGLGEPLPEDDFWWNLLGHALFHLGAWEKAAQAYTRASFTNPAMALYKLNLARSLEKSGDPGALDQYLEAASALFRDEAYDETEQILLTIGKASAQDPRVQALRGKVLFARGQKTESREVLEKVRADGLRDPASTYILGLLRKEAGELTAALELMEEAASQEPDYALFQFRLGEVKYLCGQDGGTETWKSLTLDPENPWAWNLWGLIQTDPQEKEKAFRRARDLAPSEVDIALNLAQHLHNHGRTEEAWPLAEAFLPDPKAYNWQGTLLCTDQRWEEAAQRYEKALERDPGNMAYLENLLVPLWKLERYSRLDDILVELLEKEEAPRFLIQMGDLAGLRGEIPRAEVAYWAAADQGSPEALEALANHFAALGRYHRLPAIIELMKKAGSAQVARWEGYLRTKTMESVECASCGHQWWAPKNLVDQGVLRISGEPPQDAPAGKSPATGKVYCIGCAENHMRDNRFICPETGENLKLSDDRLKWILKEILARS